MGGGIGSATSLLGSIGVDGGELSGDTERGRIRSGVSKCLVGVCGSTDFALRFR